MEQSKNTPERKFRAGAISATVWNNQAQKDGKEVEYSTVSFERGYKDKKSGEWKKTASLRVSDIPKAVVVLNKAYEYLVLKERDSAGIPVEDIAA